MINHVLFTAALASAGGLSIAQSTSTPSERRVTVIGCVTRSQPDAIATTGTTTLGPDQTRYVLVNVTLATDGKRSATADALAASVSTYRLDDSGDPTIAPHVGKKVEVTGVVQPTARANADSSQANIRTAAIPLLKIEKLQPIAGSSPSCSGR